MSIVEQIKRDFGIVVSVAEKGENVVYKLGETIVATFSKTAHGVMPASKIAAQVAEGAAKAKPVPAPAAKPAA